MLDALMPAIARQVAGKAIRIVDPLGGLCFMKQQLAHALPQTPAAPGRAPLGPADPAAQFAAFPPSNMDGKGAVSGVKQVMAFVKDITHRRAGSALPALRFGHH